MLASPSIIGSELSFPNVDRIGANSSIIVDITMSVLFNFGGMFILPIVICFYNICLITITLNTP